MADIQSVSGGGNQADSSWSPSQPQAQDASDAADQIESLIDSDGAFQWADRNEVTSAGDILAGLDAATADATIDELDSRELLNDFAEEMVDTSFVGKGLTADNRATLFDNFAKQLDAKSLVKVTDAFRAAGTPRQGEKYVAELTVAINTHTAPAAKAEMVDILADRAAANAGASAEALGQRSNDLQQAAHILSSLSGAHLETAIESLGQSGMLDEVLQASVVTEYNSNLLSGVTHITYDTSRFDTIMENVSALSDNSVKADVFAAGVEAMQGIDAEANPAVEFIRDGLMPTFEDQAANEMAVSLTKVIDSDVEGVMDELAYGGDTANGEAFTAYAKQMLEMGESGPESTSGQVFNAFDELGEIYAKLQLGNNLNGDATQRLEQVVVNQSGNETRPHATALGYFVGSVYAASSQITSDQILQGAYATAVIKGALTIVDKSKLGGPVVGGLASVAKEGVALAMYEAFVTQDLSAAQAWEMASIPVDPATGRQSIGDDAFSSLTDRIDHIFRINR